MTKAQKIIQAFATVFAIFLIVNIFGAVFLGVESISGVLGLQKKESVASSQPSKNLEAIVGNIQNGDIATLKIDVKASKLKIITGDVFKAESNSKEISCTQNNKQLIIEEKSGVNVIGPFGPIGVKAEDLVVTVPEDLVFDAVKIDAGAGSVYIEKLSAKEFGLNLAAGETKIDSLSVTGETEIEAGIGEVTIENASLHNSKLDLGVGEFEISGVFKGHTEVNAGVGEVKVNLLDKIDNYRFVVEKGIGEIRIDGKSLADNEKYGNGENNFEIDGGIGEIVVKEK